MEKCNGSRYRASSLRILQRQKSFIVTVIAALVRNKKYISLFKKICKFHDKNDPIKRD